MTTPVEQTRLTEQELAEIEAAATKATAEPWTSEWGYVGATRTLFLVRGHQFDGILFGHSCDAMENEQHQADTAFCAMARTGVPRLVAEIKDLRRERETPEAEKWRAKCELLATGMAPDTLEKLAAIAERMVRIATDQAVALPGPASVGYFLDLMFNVIHRMRPDQHFTPDDIQRIFEGLDK